MNGCRTAAADLLTEVKTALTYLKIKKERGANECMSGQVRMYFRF